MHFVIKLSPEIIIKSAPVRKRFTQGLAKNLRILARAESRSVDVQQDFEKIEVIFSDSTMSLERAVRLLGSVPGVFKFSEVERLDFRDIQEICEHTQLRVKQRLTGKTFVVRAKRSGQHDFRSVDVERQVGAWLLKHTDAAGVNLKQPDERVELEVRRSKLFILGRTWPGMGGYPLGTQEPVLSLISGGFDSSVSSYLAIRRGMTTHFLFFNLGGRAHEIGVRQVAHYLWQRYSASHSVMFISVPFEPVISEILQNIPKSYMAVALKRMMYRAAQRIAEEYGVKALVTGEAVAQVSSQTLSNLVQVESVVDTLVLRPLVTMDKWEIIEWSRKIGTDVLVENLPEYCGLVSSRPTTSARTHIIEDAERSFDFSVLEQALADHQCLKAADLLDDIDQLPVDIYQTLPPGAVVIDVRHPHELDDRPLALADARVEQIPYFRLQKEFVDLDSKTIYLLYCERGLMSRLHAELLLEAGFNNVGVYQPHSITK